MSGAIAIFVKTPGLSPVKTRLAFNLGRAKAEQFYLSAAAAVAQSVRQACVGGPALGYFAVAERAAVDSPHWRDLPCIWQGDGGLGERMAHVYRTLLQSHDFVMLVGADIPQMTSAELHAAATWLDAGSPRMVFGPSTDGGFWLFGGNCPIPLNVWTGVTYSVADTGKQFLSNIEGLGEIRTCAQLQDVDEFGDLIALRQALSQLPEALPAQRALLQTFPEIQLS